MQLKIFVLWVLTGCYWVVLFTATHLPPNQMLEGAPGGDKVHHFLAYFVLGMLLSVTLWHAMPSRRRVVPLIAFLTATAYGAIDETTQPLVGRYCEFFDWLADSAGAAAACAVGYLAHGVSARRPGPDGASDRAAVESA